MSIVFDIETGPLPEEELASRVPPFQPPDPPGPFEPDKIRYGRLGEEKRKEKYEKLKAEHEKSIANYEKECEEARVLWWEQTVEKAALSAVTGLICAIGYYSPSKDAVVLDIDDEKTMIENYWQQVERVALDRRIMIGLNIAGFDIPFLMRRSWILGVAVPEGVIERRYLNSRLFVDLAEVWHACSPGRFGYTGVNEICRALGIPGKLEDVEGKDFHKLLKTDRPLAEKYLTQDLYAEAGIARCLGVL